MYRLTRLSLQHPKAMVLALLAATLFLAAGLPHVRPEFGYRVLIGDQHPSIVKLDGFIERFGGGLPIQIAWECGEGFPCSTIFDRSALRMSDSVVQQLAPLDGVRSIRGPSNSALFVPTEHGFSVRRLVEDGEPVEDIDALAARARDDSLWVGNLISADGRVAQVVVQPSDTTSATAERLLNAIEEVLAPFEKQGFRFYLVGDPVDTILAGRDLSESMAQLIPFTVLVIALILYVLSRSLQSTLVALVTMAVALVWTFGLLGWLRWPRDGILEILAPLILVVGVCDAVHLLVRYANEIARRGSTQRESIEAALLVSSREVGSACLFTTLTTAVAFLSFATSDLETFVRFAVISAFGVVACLTLTFTLLPILVRLLPATSAPSLRASRMWNSALEAVVRTCQRRAVPILIGAAVLAVVSGIGWSRYLRVDNHWYESFGQQSRVIQSVRFIQNNLQPSESLEIEIALPDDTALEDPQTLETLSRFSEFLSNSEPLGSAHSALEALERMNRLLHDDDPDFDRMSDSVYGNAELIELISLEDDTLLEQWINFDRTRMRISVDAPLISFSRGSKLLESVRNYIEQEIPSSWGVALSGSLAINEDWIREVQSTQLRSFPTAFALVFLLAALFLNSWRLSAASMVPTLLPVIVTLGTMGWVGMSLDVGRAMIAAILIGISVDDSIHLLTAYSRQRNLGNDPVECMRQAMLAVGRPIVTTSVALALGFLTLMASAWQTLSSFGFFVSLAILGALVATLFVLPALTFVMAGPQVQALRQRILEAVPESQASRRAGLMLLVLIPVVGSIAASAVMSARGGIQNEIPCWILPNARAPLFPGLSECPLHADDAIVSIEDSEGRIHAVTNLRSLKSVLAGAENSVRIEVARDGETVWHELPVLRVSPSTRLVRVLWVALAAAGLLAIPLILLWRTRALAAVPLSLFYGATSLMLVCSFAYRDSVWLARLGLVAAVALPAIFAHLSFTFPRERRLVREAPGIVWVIYFFSAGLLFPALDALERNPLLWPVISYLLLILVSFGWAFMMLSCLFALRESHSAMERARARLLLFGASLLPLISMPLVALQVKSLVAAAGIYMVVSVLLMPLPIGLAISRYNLFNLENDTRRWIARMLYYFAGATMITAMFSLIRFWAGPEGQTLNPTPIFLLSILAMMMLEPTRVRLLGWVEARLSPRLQHLQELREHFTGRIAELRDEDQVAMLLGDAIQAGLEPRGGGIFLMRAGEWKPAHVFGVTAISRLALLEPALARLGERSILQLTEDPHGAVDEGLELLREARIEVVAPLRRGSGSLLGVMLLSESELHSPYSGAELDFVSVLAGHTALAIHNARVASELLARERQAVTGRTALALTHEMGKQLALIRTLSRRLPERLQDTKRANRDLELINELSEDLSETVQRFVQDAARPDDEEPGIVRFDDLVEKSILSMSRIHGPDRINLSMEPALRGIRVHENVERALLSVLDNALIASSKADAVHVFSTLEDGFVRIDIADRGEGMTPQQRQEAFELGYTTRNEHGGTGVGLAVSREIVEALGGWIVLDENPVGGTIATIGVPAIR